MNIIYNKKIRTIILITILVTLLSAFSLFCILFSRDYKTPEGGISYLNFTGSYSINNSDIYYKLPTNDYKKITVNNAYEIEFDLQFNRPIFRGERINIYADMVAIEAFYNGHQVLAFGDKANLPDIVSSVGNCWTYFNSVGINNTDTVKFKITSPYGHINPNYINKFLSSLSVGSYDNLLKSEIETNLFIILGAVLSFIAGFILLIMNLAFKLMKTPYSINGISCCLLIMSSALLLFLNCSCISLIFNNAFLVTMTRYVILLFIPFLLLMYTEKFVHNKRIDSTISLLMIIWSSCIVAFFIGQSSGLLDYYTFSKYIKAAAVILMTANALFFIADYKKNKNKDKKILLIASLVFNLCITIELIFKISSGEFYIYIFECGLLLFAILQFVVLMIFSKRNYEQAIRTNEMENELIQSKISIMLSQIQPHFLYNTLVVIRQLCDINPKMAKEAVTEFANYLRGNLDSLTLNTTIPFEKEMEHVENYISLEKKRFGDKINIEYDIDCIDFEVPSLTIQTVVENAIRHGISKRKSGGTVTISTKESENNYYIEIYDNGVGVDLTRTPESNKDGRSHIGIENAKKRIESMCFGTLTIDSTPSIGTTVLITIPKLN